MDSNRRPDRKSDRLYPEELPSKKLMQLGLLYVVMAIVIVVCGLVFLAIVIGMVATLLGNLAIWPIIGSAIIGYPITFPMAIGIAAVMAVIIYMFVGSISKQTEDKMVPSCRSGASGRSSYPS